MTDRKLIYAALAAVLVCSVAFLGCPTAEEMADDVIQPTPTTPEVTPPEEDTPEDTPDDTETTTEQGTGPRGGTTPPDGEQEEDAEDAEEPDDGGFGADPNVDP